MLRYFFDKFDYYAKPEGQDPLNKIVGVSKYCAFTGILIGTNDIIAISKTKTFYDSARCLGFWVVPLTGMGCAFASTTYIATNLRGKDDPWNYVIGGTVPFNAMYFYKTKNELSTYFLSLN